MLDLNQYEPSIFYPTLIFKMFAMASPVVARLPRDPLQNLELATAEATTAKFTQLLQHCIDARSLSHGKYIHDRLVEQGKQQDPALSNLLVRMYAECGSIDEARSVLDEIRVPSGEAWSAMVLAYSKNSQSMDALQLVRLMDLNGVKLEGPLLLRLLDCVESLEVGKCFHGRVAAAGLEDDIPFGNALITMYSKFGSLVDAEAVFEQMSRKNVGTWNSMIAAFASTGDKYRALQLYCELVGQGLSLKPNQLTFITIFELFSSPDSVAEAMATHALVAGFGYDKEPEIVKALITTYARCGRQGQARRAFDWTRKKSIDVWNTMITADALNGQPVKALDLYKTMESELIQPDHLTFAGVLSACESLRDLEKGRMIHKHVKLFDMETNPTVATGLLNMYSKCGSLEDARQVFNRMQDRGCSDWCSMISAYAQAGRCEEALGLFKEMEAVPDQETFLEILAACFYYGWMNEGLFYFRTMQQAGVRPSDEHFACIVALLMKPGPSTLAENFIDNMPYKPGEAFWKVVMSCL